MLWPYFYPKKTELGKHSHAVLYDSSVTIATLAENIPTQSNTLQPTYIYIILTLQGLIQPLVEHKSIFVLQRHAFLLFLHFIKILPSVEAPGISLEFHLQKRNTYSVSSH